VKIEIRSRLRGMTVGHAPIHGTYLEESGLNPSCCYTCSVYGMFYSAILYKGLGPR